MKKKTLIIISSVAGGIIIILGILAYLSYSSNDGHWCSPGTHWGLGYNEAGMSKEQIEANSRCLDDGKLY